MKEQHNASEFTQSVLNSLKTLVDANSIVGQPITTPEGAVVIPISKVSFGYAAGGSDLPTQRPDLFGGGTGGGVTIQPLAFLVIQGEKVELLQMQTANNTADRIVNTVPGVLDKLLDLIPHKDKENDKQKQPLEDQPSGDA